MFWPKSGKRGLKGQVSRLTLKRLRKRCKRKQPAKPKQQCPSIVGKSCPLRFPTRKLVSVRVHGDRRLLELGSAENAGRFLPGYRRARYGDRPWLGDGPIRRLDLARNSPARPRRRQGVGGRGPCRFPKKDAGV